MSPDHPGEAVISESGATIGRVASECHAHTSVGAEVVGRGTGEAQEHVVEAGSTKLDVDDVALALVEGTDGVGDSTFARTDRDNELGLRGVGFDRGGSQGSEGVAARSTFAKLAMVTINLSPPTRSFNSSAVPSAITLPRSITAMESASASASSRYCVVKNVVVPSVPSSSISSHIASRLRGSRPVVGSSKNSTDGRAMRLMAMSMRRRIPPE